MKKRRKKPRKSFLKKNLKYLIATTGIIVTYILFSFIPWHYGRIETSNQLKEEVKSVIEWQGITVLQLESIPDGTKHQIVAEQNNWKPDCYVFSNMIKEHGLEQVAYLDMDAIDIHVYAKLRNEQVFIFKIIIS